uniref:Uncharacterized protein n=1 Tax=Anopheles minimus TaxID=112268 RepID=A0A182WAX8_9DIPT
QIPLRVLPELQPLLETVPASQKDVFAKKVPVEHFKETQRSRLHRLMYSLELGDRKPSKLLAEMRRAAIAFRGSTADKTAVADAVMECIASHSRGAKTLAEVKTTADFEQRISRELAILNRKLNEFIEETRRRDLSRNRPLSRSRTPVRDPESSSNCYYHRRFGAAARSCRRSCKYSAPTVSSPREPSSSF